MVDRAQPAVDMALPRAARAARTVAQDRTRPVVPSRPLGPRPPARRRSQLGSIRSARYAAFYLSPAMLIFLVFTLGPAVFVLYISFFHWNLLNSGLSKFAALANYHTELTSTAFLSSVVVSLYFVGATVIGTTFLALFIAVALSDRRPLRGLARLAVFSPYVTPLVATSIVWVWIFNPEFGLIDSLLHMMGLPQPQWLESSTTAMPAVIIYTLWHNLGFTVIIFLAGLTMISPDLSDAAKVDGASRWQEFWRVTWPQLTPTTLFVVVISTIEALQAFTQIYTMTGGGPSGATTTTSYLLYMLAFVFFDAGHGAALAVILFLAIAGLTFAELRVSRRRNADIGP